MGKHERVRAEVDLSAIEYNLENMYANIRPDAKIAAVIKTDGYGHGAVEIGRRIEERPYLWGFAVATFEEALKLRKAGLTKPLLILGYSFPDCYEELAELSIRPAVFREDTLRQLSEAAGRTGKEIRVHIAVDTAMSRIGVTADEKGIGFVRQTLQTPGLFVEGVFTHFSRADETDRETTLRQIRDFKSFLERIEKELGYRVPLKHCSNSAGIISYPEANLDMVRAGITLYGLRPSDEVPEDAIRFRRALSLYSHIVYVKEIEKGTAVSYGGTYVADRRVRVATIPVGYGDGYPRTLSNKGFVLIRGKRAPILGRVCMDQFMVDVTEIPGAQEGDQVTLIGCDGEETITMEMLGGLSGRFNYELACDLGVRIPRVYRLDQK